MSQIVDEDDDQGEQDALSHFPRKAGTECEEIAKALGVSRPDGSERWGGGGREGNDHRTILALNGFGVRAQGKKGKNTNSKSNRRSGVTENEEADR